MIWALPLEPVAEVSFCLDRIETTPRFAAIAPGSTCLFARKIPR